jgi:hypothetical protein
MPDINIGQQGKLRSVPKLTKINGDDDLSLIYRNMGNNHAYPFVWAETMTFSGSGGTKTLLSGVKFHGMKAADYCKISLGAGATGMNPYFTKNSGANTITITSSAAGSVDIIVMVGANPDVKEIACRGNTGAYQSLP